MAASTQSRPGLEHRGDLGGSLREVVDRVRETGRGVVLSESGEVLAVVLSMGAFEELQAAAEQAALQRAVDEAERDCAAGRLLEHEDVMARMQRWIGEDEPDDR